MFKYNNTHIFTGYLKQLLASFNLPACRIYTHEFAEHLERTGKEDPRILESFDTINDNRVAVRINYLKNNELYNYFCASPTSQNRVATWNRSAEVFYNSDKSIHGLTRNLENFSNTYDVATHEYLGDYLRFIRDYYDINLLPLYNCFNNKLYNNVYFTFDMVTVDAELGSKRTKIVFDSQNQNYRLYAIPVKLFSDYTIAIDCSQGVEMFCGLYNTTLDTSSKAEKLAAKTYVKAGKAMFNQPFLYEKLNILNWSAKSDFITDTNNVEQIRTDQYTRWDIANREQDLRLFIKVPTSCKSSITILEGDYRTFNNVKFAPVAGKWHYKQNHCVLNFNTKKTTALNGDGIDLNSYKFKPISKLQLLAFNTGESYPFSDRLVEYLCGSAITPLDEIPDNIKRVQRVMEQNRNYFKIEGLWENKMQNILYDYMNNSGPVVVLNDKLVDKRQGYHTKLGHSSKSTLYDVLGYVDKDTEKLYSSWKKENSKAYVNNNIQNVDIYNGLYDI